MFPLILFIIYLAFRLVILRPIHIQLNDTGITLYYHFSHSIDAVWDDIEWISKFDGDGNSQVFKTDRGGKMKMKDQGWPVFLPNEVASAIVDAYKGSGQMRRIGEWQIIE